MIQAGAVGKACLRHAKLAGLFVHALIYRKAPEERSAPASLTKMMTIILALEALGGM